MAESFKYEGNLNDAVAVFPNLPWRKRGYTNVSIFDAKKDEYVQVNKGDYIVSIGDRFEVSDTEPRKAKPVEPEPEETSTVEETEASDEASE